MRTPLVPLGLSRDTIRSPIPRSMMSILSLHSWTGRVERGCHRVRAIYAHALSPSSGPRPGWVHWITFHPSILPLRFLPIRYAVRRPSPKRRPMRATSVHRGFARRTAPQHNGRRKTDERTGCALHRMLQHSIPTASLRGALPNHGPDLEAPWGLSGGCSVSSCSIPAQPSMSLVRGSGPRGRS